MLLLGAIPAEVAPTNIRSRKKSSSSRGENKQLGIELFTNYKSNEGGSSHITNQRPRALSNSTSSDLNSTSYPLPTGCFNDDRYIYKDHPKMTCKWIRWKEIRRTSLCKESEVRSACPQTCGICCENDPTYLFSVHKHLNVSCTWIEEHQYYSSLCNTFSNGRMVRDGCPVVCNFCKEFVPLHQEGNLSPSIAPSSSDAPAVSTNYDSIMNRAFPQYSPATSTPPTPSSTNLQSVASLNPTNDCHDNDFYQNPLGGHCGCSLFESTDCLKWDIFLSAAEIDELLENCPLACGICR